jgi:hypothetical protein
MNKSMLVVALSLAFAGVCFAADSDQLDQSRHGRKTILSFHTMYGVDGPFVGEANAVRDVAGDELPWEILGFARGTLDSHGRLTIFVRGLVFADDPLVPPELVGTNDEAEFRALVSCLTEVGDAVETANVITEGFPADMQGNSFIRAQVDLPNPCVAPIVMILAGSEDKWFAMTGFESEKDDGDSQSP